MSELKELPEGWAQTSLGGICLKADIVRRKEMDPHSSFLYLDIGSIDNKTNRLVSYKEYTWGNAPSRAQQIIFQNDILFSTVRTYLKNIALVERSKYNGQIASSGFTVIRGNKSVTVPKYLFYISFSQAFLQPLNELQTGTSYPAVRDNDVFSQIIPLPPLPEQHRIVAKIEELFSSLDKGIENLKTAQAQLKTYRQAVLKYAFEGRLTNENVKDGELPEGWKWLKIEDIAESLDHLRRPINRTERLKRAGTIPYYGANGRTGWIDDYLFDEPLILVVEDETFVGRELPFSYKIMGKAWVNNHAHILRPKKNLHIDFLNYQLAYYPFLPLTTGTTGRKKLTKNALMNAPFKVCPLPEQHRIVSEIETRLSVCDKLEESITQSLLQAEALRQSILKKAFEGKLVPQDPNDEPASALLERIRAERESVAAKNAAGGRGKKKKGQIG